MTGFIYFLLLATIKIFQSVNGFIYFLLVTIKIFQSVNDFAELENWNKKKMHQQRHVFCLSTMRKSALRTSRVLIVVEEIIT